MADRQVYNASGEPGRRQLAVKRAKAYRGQIAYERNRKPFATERMPGSGGFTMMGGRQRLRSSMASADKKRSEALRPDSPSSAKADLYR